VKQKDKEIFIVARNNDKPYVFIKNEK